MRRLLAATAWIAGGAALFACYLRISFTAHVTSDGANNALQAWDMLHGHLLMHGWIVGDATYYTFDLPVLMLTEIFFGLQDLTSHVASALIYLVVTVCAVALAVADSRGLARLARAGVVVAVLTAAFHVESNAPYLLGAPDHTGTSVFLLVSVLLIDRAPARRYTSPLLLAILCAGQIGDATVGYVAVPAVVVVSVYRVAAARKVRTGDAANALAAVASVPLAAAVRALMLYFGAYQMVSPRTAIAPPGQWPHNAAIAWHAIRVLFGAEVASGSANPARDAGYILGIACCWPWRSASRGWRGPGVPRAGPSNSCAPRSSSTSRCMWSPPSRFLAIPTRWSPSCRAAPYSPLAPACPGTWPTGCGLVTSLAAVVALLPLATAAARPAAAAPTAPLAAWLEAHGLTYGLAGYWNSSVITLHSGGRVQARAVVLQGSQVSRYDWETDTAWFDPSRHDATFLITDLDGIGLSPSAEQYFGKPYKIEHVAHWVILIYQKNLLRHVAVAGSGS